MAFDNLFDYFMIAKSARKAHKARLCKSRVLLGRLHINGGKGRLCNGMIVNDVIALLNYWCVTKIDKYNLTKA